MKLGAFIKVFLGFFISISLVVWISLSVNWSQVIQESGKLEYIYVFPLLALLYLQFWLRTVRWSYLLSGKRHDNESLLFDGIMIGNLATNLLPLRAGEFIRPYVVSSGSQHLYASCFLTVVLERFFDLAVVLIFFGAVTSQVSSLDNWVYRGAAILSLLAGIILSAILLGVLFPTFVKKGLDLCVQIIKKMPFPSFSTRCALIVEKIGETFLNSTKTIKDIRVLVTVAVLSVLVWLSTFAFYQVFLYAFGLPLDTSLWFGITIAVIIALAVAAPSAPGFIGVYQTAAVVVFSLFGLGKELGIAYGIVSHLFQYLFVLITGLWSISRRGMRLKELVHVRRLSAEAV
jgi:glycosyltransferase 2 family protein